MIIEPVKFWAPPNVPIEHIVNMIVFRDNLVIATNDGVYITDNLETIKLESKNNE